MDQPKSEATAPDKKLSLVVRFLLNRQWWFFPILLLGLIIGYSYYLNRAAIEHYSNEVALASARNIFNTVRLHRLWNSKHGGVYVPVTESVKPNPYIDTPKRDIETKEGNQYTLINPALMTRQVSDLSIKEGGTSFRISSLNPIRPANLADAWESKALKRFSQGDKEVLEAVLTDEGMLYRYMAPLIIKEPCLQCHAAQGAKLGDIYGGISVTLRPNLIAIAENISMAYALTIHLMTFLICSALFLFFMGRMRHQWLVLEQIKSNQEKVIEERTRELKHLATHDPLTGLYNRNKLEQLVELEVRRADRYGNSFTLFLLDIDHFKEVNDRYGHQVGDQVLSAFSNVLLSSMRKTDYVARVGGEEFYIILPETPLKSAIELAERLRKKIAEMSVPIEDGKSISVTTSIGVAVFPNQAKSWGELCKLADEKLYEAKAAGRDCVKYLADPS